MDHIKINQVVKSFGDFEALKETNLSIKQGEFFTLLGPSGCGKTTLLRTIAGFYKQNRGNIYFGDQLMDHIPAHNKDIGMVFQNYAIFPHLTVFDNVAYGLRARKQKKDEIETKVMEALKMVEMEHLRDRRPADLSGGQQQRIALARAVVIRPKLLLMDEPLSNLDAKLRIKMREDIRKLQKDLDITTIYVTHDQEEALAVSDRIAVLNDGVVLQVGTPHEIYLAPEEQFVARFIGSANFLSVQSTRSDGGDIAEISWMEASFTMPVNEAYPGGEAIYCIRPEFLSLKKEGEKSGGATVTGEVTEIQFLGDKVAYEVNIGHQVTIRVNEYAVNVGEFFEEGEKVSVYLHPESAILFNLDGKAVSKGHAKK